MATTRSIVQEELGHTEAASLISAAIQILVNENYSGVPFSEEKVIHLAWKAKHMVDANCSQLAGLPLYEQQNVIKLYLEGQPATEILPAGRHLEVAFT
ncbi:MAG: hypothetical protein R3208_03190 [Ketobacteraceae bacterium]|nr:hypothetical protein [Ketobacteraceae bacterium]